MACIIDLDVLFLDGQTPAVVQGGEWFTGATVDCCWDCAANPQVRVCPDPPGGASINNPSALVITTPANTVDFENATPGCYWFRYETPAWAAALPDDAPTKCATCGDCQMYAVTVIEMADLVEPGDVTTCARGTCTDFDRINIWKRFDCPSEDPAVSAGNTCSVCETGGITCNPALAECIVRHIFLNGTNNVFSGTQHNAEFSCTFASYTGCNGETSATYKGRLTFSEDPRGAYNASTGVFDPCTFKNAGGVGPITVTLRIWNEDGDAVCTECDVTADFIITITDGENAGVTSTEDQVCS